MAKPEASDELRSLLNQAAEASPSTRIEFRDQIAAHGAAAIDAIEPWFADAHRGAFAVRVVERAAAYNADREAVAALRRAGSAAALPTIANDAADAIRRLRPTASTRSGDRQPRAPRRPRTPTMGPEDLVVGQVYRRKDLHDAGLGGNRQAGISYPADGTHVLLFSDPDAAHEHGYKDAWSGDTYRYFGQWTGSGDMVYEVGNRAILDRSEELYLLVAAPGGYRFEGHFRLANHEPARTVRDGRELTAIVFILEPVTTT